MREKMQINEKENVLFNCIYLEIYHESHSLLSQWERIIFIQVRARAQHTYIYTYIHTHINTYIIHEFTHTRNRFTCEINKRSYINKYIYIYIYI